jgi:D-hydroxyproline dehydrogenase subunit alpha
VGVIDDNPAPGGQIWRGVSEHPPAPAAAQWYERLMRSGAERIFGASVIAQPAGGVLVAEGPEGGFPVRYGKLVIATGARERFLPFPGWTLPGVMGAGGLQALVKGGLPIAGKRVVIAGSGPLLLAVAEYLKRRGARILRVSEQAPTARVRQFAMRLFMHPAKAAQGLKLRLSLAGIPYHTGSWPVAAGGGEALEWVELLRDARRTRIPCDYLACGFHLIPNLELAELLGCELDGKSVHVDELQETSLAGVYCAGEPCGIGGLETALVEGQIAGYAAVGNLPRARALFAKRKSARRFANLLERTFVLRDELRGLATPETLVCRCEDVTHARLTARMGWRDAKLHTRCGMGPCQGRVCGPATEFIFGWRVESVRPPVFPASVESLIRSAAVRK